MRMKSLLLSILLAGICAPCLATDVPEGWSTAAPRDEVKPPFTYHVPSQAAQAVVELEFRWAPHTHLEWADVSLTETTAPAPRIVRLATVHFVPKDAKTPDERRLAFVPMIEDAAKRKADLVV